MNNIYAKPVLSEDSVYTGYNTPAGSIFLNAHRY